MSDADIRNLSRRLDEIEAGVSALVAHFGLQGKVADWKAADDVAVEQRAADRNQDLQAQTEGRR